MQDSFNLSRFVEAQRRVFSRVMDELRAGRKTSHWTWFVFPANAGAGSLRSKLIFHPARNQ
ncbi:MULTISPECIES: DUF1810 family protein [Pseudomonas]|uniref:DUF1810 family protein n=1 Tax=Pseudomonas TaxID=286 RepID=UPI0009118A4E|nr:Protein of unknown function [Pseudomonas sp. NFPP02]